MFIINPDPYNTPLYRIGAFTTSGLKRNNNIDQQWGEFAKNYFDNRFGKENWLITTNGREAINLAMRLLNLTPEKNVTILTPSQNLYISGCVTSTLSKYCGWDRVLSGNTFAHFVNHEFGYLYPNIGTLLETGLPLIEDCCTTFFSQDSHKKIGLYGDYSIFSFPKFFNLQIGGLLVGKNIGLNNELKSSILLSKEQLDYIYKVVGYELGQENNLLAKRSNIFEYAVEGFQKLGFTLRFPNQIGVVPSVLLLNNNGIIKDLPSFKDFMYLQGIQNSLFYGEDAFFLPNHQYLEEDDINYFLFATEQFLLAEKKK